MTGPVPSELGNARNLSFLILKGNQLQGYLPTQLGNLTHLTNLDIGENSTLLGALPLTLTNLHSLQWFDFSGTWLCVPDDSNFLNWLASVPHVTRSGLNCASLANISGRVVDAQANPLPGVQIAIQTLGSLLTDAGGYYRVQSVPPGTYTVAPSKGSYVFSPTTRSVTVPPTAEGVNFVGTRTAYEVSGRISYPSGIGLPEVTVTDNAGHSVTTDNLGNFTLAELAPGNVTLTPSKNGYVFCPRSRTVAVPPNQVGQDFTGLAATTTLAFCPDTNGYRFCNGPVNKPCDEGWGTYPDRAPDYRWSDLIRMFGQDAACLMIGSICIPKPQAIDFYEEANQAINNGYCDGMASTSLRFFTGADQISTFNSTAGTVNELSLSDVRYHIAYYMVEQATDPVKAYKEQVRQNFPSAILS